MNDLISRQAAIDAMAELQGRASTKAELKGISKAWKRIKQLPSVQREAKPPKLVAEDRYVKNRFAVFPHCPQCNAEVTTGQCYCMICGQHIDWSEDDE